MKILLAQMHIVCGDISHNFSKITYLIDKYGNKNDLIIFPEFALVGYPLEDLILNEGFIAKANYSLDKLVKHSVLNKVAFAITHPQAVKNKIYNTLFLIQEGNIIAKIHKTCLPNYGVFDEKRIFNNGHNNHVVHLNNKKIGFLICEDAWTIKIPKKLASEGADILIALNASPYDLTKQERRSNLAAKIVSETKLPFIYVNMFGAMDDITFDGGSFALDENGKYLIPPNFWQESFTQFTSKTHPLSRVMPEVEHIYNALIMGLRTYILNNGFKKALVAVSGGIDSALVAVLAADAIGSENVIMVRLPSKFSSHHSLYDAAELASNLGSIPLTISIENIVELITENLRPFLKKPIDKLTDITDENLQSRSRGILMMALSNNYGAILLATGNKSEFACGYATLYGDTCGGFAPIKDVYKTQIYEICNYRNKNIPSLSIFKKLNVIPQNTIDKPPSAELHEGQLDSDSLPLYDELDKILFQLIENDLSIKSVIKEGYNKKLVKRIANMITKAEYKRRQAPPGTKISVKNFSKDRRYPITNLYNENDE